MSGSAQSSSMTSPPLPRVAVRAVPVAKSGGPGVTVRGLARPETGGPAGG
jgi:hypothetical protein